MVRLEIYFTTQHSEEVAQLVCIRVFPAVTKDFYWSQRVTSISQHTAGWWSMCLLTSSLIHAVILYVSIRGDPMRLLFISDHACLQCSPHRRCGSKQQRRVSYRQHASTSRQQIKPLYRHQLHIINTTVQCITRQS